MLGLRKLKWRGIGRLSILWRRDLLQRARHTGWYRPVTAFQSRISAAEMRAESLEARQTERVEVHPVSFDLVRVPFFLHS